MNTPVTPSATPPNHLRPTLDNKMRRARRPVLMAAVAMALLMQPSYVQAQHGQAPAGQSEKEKAKIRDKMILEKETDEAYKSTITRIPDSKQKVDPWGNIRTAPTK